MMPGITFKRNTMATGGVSHYIYFHQRESFSRLVPHLFFPPFFVRPLQDQTEHNSSIVRSQTNTAIIRGLKPGGIYVFQVRARTVAGFGRYSGKMYFQTMTEGKRRATAHRVELWWIISLLDCEVCRLFKAPVRPLLTNLTSLQTKSDCFVISTPSPSAVLEKQFPVTLTQFPFY